VGTDDRDTPAGARMNPAEQAGGLMQAEIAEQPAVVERILTLGEPEVERVAAVIAASAPRVVLLAARGSSDHAALYAKYLVEVLLGLPAGLVSPSTSTVYGARADLRGVLWIGISQSGTSPDLVESTTAARRAGALTLAVTNGASSPLARACAYHLDVLAGPEIAVAATKSYTAQLLTLWLLVQRWSGGATTGARALPGQISDLLSRSDVDEVAARYRFAGRIVATGRGYSYPTARESALKLMETTYATALAFSAADLMHGPLAAIDTGCPVLAVVPNGRAGAAMAPTLDAVRAQGADLCVVGPHPVGGHADARLEVPLDLPESLAPVLEIIPVQRLALQMARSRRLDPDAPRTLQKVTRTH
jgi:glucosamine--fructose-6-phosphate aminotransferase (isomerizing)